MTCTQCGSLLSAVTFTCILGEYCKPKADIHPFQTARPCWLSPLRQIALIEAAEELNERLDDVANDRFRAGFDGYVLKSEVR